MAMLNPVNALIVPFLFITTIPLAIFASITTLVAFSILSLRVIVVYLDLALSMLPRPVAYKDRLKHLSAPSSIASASVPNSRSSSPTLVHRRRRRRSSATSLPSASSATSLTDSRGLGLIPSIGAGRDYEGIGGWRVGGTAADDEAWTSVSNPRLELPGGDHLHQYRHHHTSSTNIGNSSKLYHHHRSLSGGPATPGDVGYLMMKSRTRSPEATAMTRLVIPNSSRARTPPVPRSAPNGTLGDSYFPASHTHSPSKATRRPSVSAEH
ncbi:hypothetical protein NLU13_4870 [Sarocladium strictum]|uniref:Uncharacterized protein n=1 Tax=Sarocladium strictum TaxID=5046 RepID=A0AA39GJQ2_SARSR|nr:hypothetical protein NLU13_4870 [Sarocladium strictum]